MSELESQLSAEVMLTDGWAVDAETLVQVQGEYLPNHYLVANRRGCTTRPTFDSGAARSESLYNPPGAE